MKPFVKAMAKELRRTALDKLTPEQRALLPRCTLTLEVNQFSKELYIAGQVDDHNVSIYRDCGTIDGGAISKEEAARLFEKYYPIMQFQLKNFEREAEELALAKEAETVAKTL